METLIKKYINSNFRNDVILLNLDLIEFKAFVWQLKTGRFETTGFSTKGFLRYVMTNTKQCIDIINDEKLTKENFIKLLK